MVRHDVRVAGRCLLVFATLALLPPSPRAQEADVPQEAVVGALPFQPTEEPHRIFIDLAPDGHRPFLWLLDTGASESVMTPRAARSAGVSVRRVKADPYRRGTRLGRDVHFRVDTRSSDSASKTGWEYALLGSDFLKHFVLEIDFEARLVRFLDPERFQVPERTAGAREVVLPLRLDATRPVLPASVNGKLVRLMLDTGAPGTLLLSGRVAEQTGVVAIAGTEFTGGTVLGPMELVKARVDLFALGPHEFGSMPALIAPKGWYNQAGAAGSIVGAALLEEFLVRIDYPRQRLWLRRVAPAAKETRSGETPPQP